MAASLRSCWQNCCALDDERCLADPELKAIDAMEDALGPLDESTVAIRALIGRFEVCYHEADAEAERIVKAIGTGRCPVESNERPPQRRRELENTRDILSSWCEDPTQPAPDLTVGDVPAAELLGCIGEPSPLKVWQVRRIVDKVTEALDPSVPYRNIALAVGDYGEPDDSKTNGYGADEAPFVRQTAETIIEDTLDGRPSKVSLAMAIDLFMPCHWDFAGSLATILSAIGGDLHPKRPYACCARNVALSPLCPRLETISNTLNAFWTDRRPATDPDPDVLAWLGEPTPAKRWLAASLDKTIRLQLTLPFDVELV